MTASDDGRRAISRTSSRSVSLRPEAAGHAVPCTNDVLVAIGYIPGEVGAKAPEGQPKTIGPQAGGDTVAGGRGAVIENKDR